MYSLFDSVLEITEDICAVSVLDAKKRKVIVLESLEGEKRKIAFAEFTKSDKVFDDVSPIPSEIIFKEIRNSTIDKTAVLREAGLPSRVITKTWRIQKEKFLHVRDALEKDSQAKPNFISINYKSNKQLSNNYNLASWVSHILGAGNIVIPPEGDPNMISPSFSLSIPSAYNKREEKTLMDAIHTKNMDLLHATLKDINGDNLNFKAPKYYWHFSFASMESVDHQMAGHTPLTFATKCNFVDVIQSLVTAGANVDEPNGKNRTPMDIAIKKSGSNSEIVKYFYKLDAQHTNKLLYIPIYSGVDEIVSEDKKGFQISSFYEERPTKSANGTFGPLFSSEQKESRENAQAAGKHNSDELMVLATPSSPLVNCGEETKSQQPKDLATLESSCSLQNQ